MPLSLGGEYGIICAAMGNFFWSIARNATERRVMRFAALAAMAVYLIAFLAFQICKLFF